MAKGENIFKRKDGRWEARYIRGYELSGKIKYGFCYGKTYKEAKEKVTQCKPVVASGTPIQSGETQMRHGAGHCKAAGDCGSCDRHVCPGAESPQDSVRPFELAHMSSGDSRSEQKLDTCSVGIS